MKSKTMLRTVEKAVGRALTQLVEAHPEAIRPNLVASLEKRLVGMLCVEMLRSSGHKVELPNREPGEHYRPSRVARTFGINANTTLEEPGALD